ncbi:thioredoxin, mitochondrial-like [Mytilus californianus]|uniref:thioredoxin, mitochondrial-like n=1 Tax=Mytilus californianus TaxID=6549 RepID=UPI00224661B8|nr:thioredoxin, mitochondrial-like [Mytilus californianus]XP_052059330.1 thioredoxin, mitochondrial-like [Mytilus californianus]
MTIQISTRIYLQYGHLISPYLRMVIGSRQKVSRNTAGTCLSKFSTRTLSQKFSRSTQTLSQKSYSCYFLTHKLVQKQTLLSINLPATVRQSLQCLSTEPNFEQFIIQSESDFDKKVLESPIPVVVYFFTRTCVPCAVMAPRLEDIIVSYGTAINYFKVDVDSHRTLAKTYVQGKSGVKVMPTLIGMKNGQVVSKIRGLKSEEQIKKFVDNLVI